MRKELLLVLAFVLTTLSAMTLFSYEPPQPVTRYDCPADGSGFAADNIQFPACENGVVAYDVQFREAGNPNEWITSPVYARS